MNKINNIINEFKYIPTITRNLIYLFEEPKINNDYIFKRYSLDKNGITCKFDIYYTVSNFKLVNKDILPQKYMIDTYIILNDTHNKILLHEWCNFTKYIYTDNYYFSYNLKIKNNFIHDINYNSDNSDTNFTFEQKFKLPILSHTDIPSNFNRNLSKDIDKIINNINLRLSI